MNKMIRFIAVGIFGLLMLVLVSACTGVTQNPSGGTSVTIVGKVQSVDAKNHTVTLNVNGQVITISNLTDQQVALLQNQVGKNYRIQVTQNSDGTYNANTNSNPVEDNTATPGIEQSETPGPQQTEAPSQGSISFIGTVKTVSASSITVSMPDGSSLTMSIVNGQTKMENGLPTANQLVKVEATANTTDGSFTATSLKPADANESESDKNTVDYKGTTSSAVGSDNVIHFKVGNKSFSFTISSSTKLKDFANAQAIGANQLVKVTVQFNGSTGTVLKVENASN
jgi:hypothetical protein